jgi:hypothetical protein
MDMTDNKIVIFCKSYKKDMFRARRMAESVQRFNTDNIPLYVSVPSSDVILFKQCFDNIPCQFVTDEEILDLSCRACGHIPRRFPSDLLQQLIKLEFWRMNLCENYLWIDSDSYFIRNFSRSDFLDDDDHPYTVQHELQELRDFAMRWNKPRIIKDFEKMAKTFQKISNRSGCYFDFGPSPVVWSTRVLKSLHEEYLPKEKKSIYQLLEEYPCELQLYGEYLYKSNTIPIHPIKPLFRVFHYAEQFYESQMMGESESSISRQYLGIVMQSNWSGVKRKKTISDRIMRKLYILFNAA